MPSQILGLLLAVGGAAWFIFSIASGWPWTLPQEDIKAAKPLWGLIAFLGGLILWALGRIEFAIAMGQHGNKDSAFLTVVAYVIVAATIALFIWQINLGRV